MRKIIQIVSDDNWLFALCDDGSLWQSTFSINSQYTKWCRLSDIPQDPPPSEQEDELPLDPPKPSGYRDRLGLVNDGGV